MQIAERQPGVVSIKLNKAETRVLSREVQDVKLGLPNHTEVTLLDEIQERGRILEGRMTQVADFLGDMATHRGVKVAVFELGANTVEGVGPTPTQYPLKAEGQNLFTSDLYRGLLVSLPDWYGYGYTTQQDAIIHNNVIQVQEHATTKGHSGSAVVELGLHVEDASFNLGPGFDLSPDFLTLHFFRNPLGIPTTLSMPDWSTLSTTTRDILSETWYINQTNPLQGGAKNTPTRPVSILYGPDSDPWMRLNAGNLKLDGYDHEQADAAVDFVTHLEQHKTYVGAQAGEVVIFDNRRVLHGRAPYRQGDLPKYDGTDRWQRRLVVSNDPARIQEFEASPRIVDPVSLLAKAAA